LKNGSTTEQQGTSKSSGFRILLSVLAALSVGAIIIIGYEIAQNYKKSKKIANLNLSENTKQQQRTNLDYKLIEDFRKDGDDLGIQNL
jgi:hypothetical protein